MNALWKNTLNAYAQKRLKPRWLEVLACYRAYAADGIMSPTCEDVAAICGVHPADVARDGRQLAADGLLLSRGTRPSSRAGAVRSYPDDVATCARIDAMIASVVPS